MVTSKRIIHRASFTAVLALFALATLVSAAKSSDDDDKNSKSSKTQEDEEFEIIASDKTAEDTEDCASLEDCGDDKDFPTYYDFYYSPGSMYTMTKLAFIQGWLYTFIFHVKNTEYLFAKGGRKEIPKMKDQFDYFNKDMPEWLQYMRRLAISHASLWGTATLLYAFAMSGILPSLACFWIAHVISNFEWVIYGYGTYLLIAASVSWGWVFGYLMMAFIFWGLSWFTFGMGAINFLDPDYPYTDGNLIPSIFYLFIDHERPLEFDYDWADLEDSKDSEID